MSKSREKYINFTLLTPKLTALGVGGGGHLISFPYMGYILNLVKIGPVKYEEKMFSDDAGSQPIAIRHPSDSVDLKIQFHRLFVCLFVLSLSSHSSRAGRNMTNKLYLLLFS